MRRSLILSSIFVAGFALATGAYIVKKGDTLWDLSAQFFNDPFSWPDLWDMNRHVQDPHWIYPGDSLYISEAGSTAPIDTVSKLEAAESMTPAVPPPSDSLLPEGVSTTAQGGSRDDEFRRNLGDLSHKVRADEANPKGDSTQYTYRKNPPPAVFNPYYQLFAPRLFSTETFKTEKSWISIHSGEKKPNLMIHNGDEILMEVGIKGAPVKVGGGVELWTVEPVQFSVKKDSLPRQYALTRLTGLGKITAVGDTLTRVIVTRTMAAMDLEKVRIRLPKPVPSIKVKSYKPVAEGKFETMPRVRYVIDPSLMVGIHNYIIVDGGKSANLNPGDGVAFLENSIIDPSLPPRVLGRGVVVSSEAKEATVLVRELHNATRPLENGARVALTHRAMKP